ncbi:hypothetical protein ABZ352_36845 [Streptomyces griseofuscus]|uniref:hypothetical protein n=1 Tax=Streptomyces griseofuscus TaxID=146922 RepID=UPI003402F790
MLESASPLRRDTPTAALAPTPLDEPPPPQRTAGLTPPIIRLTATDPHQHPTVPAAKAVTDGMSHAVEPTTVVTVPDLAAAVLATRSVSASLRTGLGRHEDVRLTLRIGHGKTLRRDPRRLGELAAAGRHTTGRTSTKTFPIFSLPSPQAEPTQGGGPVGDDDSDGLCEVRTPAEVHAHLLNSGDALIA